jgi:GDP-6-deoxy-D-talose 4-dehydrogenase
MKKLLIIGIDSFTGRHLKVYLEKYNFDVYGTAYGQSQNKVFQCDITKNTEIKNILEYLKPEYIINLAGISFVKTEDREIFYQVNVLAVENILESILKIDNYIPTKIILVSSATIYGNQSSTILDETMAPNPVNHYGISKFAMEQLAKTFYEQIDIIITRPFNYTGIGQSKNFLIPKIVSHYKNKKEIIELGNIDVFREFNDISYVSEIYKRLLESEVKSEILNVASNRTIALKDVIKDMNDIAKYKIKIKINPDFVRKNEIEILSGSSDKLFSLIGEVNQKEFKNTLLEMYND